MRSFKEMVESGEKALLQKLECLNISPLKGKGLITNCVVLGVDK